MIGRCATIRGLLPAQITTAELLEEIARLTGKS